MPRLLRLPPFRSPTSLRDLQSLFPPRQFLSRAASSAPQPSPPLLLKLRADLKTALKARDATRLSVLRGLLADVTTAEKAALSSFSSDAQVLALLRKREHASRHAAQEFERSGRPDLREVEEAQVRVLEEYVMDFEGDMLGRDEVQRIVEGLVGEMRDKGEKTDVGRVMRAAMGRGGAFEGKAVEGDVVKEVVKEVVSGS